MSTLHGEYRRHDRTGIKTSVSLDLADSELSTKTRDVSVSGLSLRKPANFSVEPGKVVNLSFSNMPNINVPAKIVRVSDKQVSLEFDHFRFSTGDIEGIINTSPWHQRLRVKLKRTFWKTTRYTATMMTNTIARTLLIKAIKPSFLFAVYGNEKDTSTYYSPAMSNFMPDILIGGLIKNRNRRGLLVASKFYEQELVESPEKVNAYMHQLQRSFPGINTIALVGRLPNFVMKSGIEIEPPYVDGSMGTRYMIWDVACQMRGFAEYRNETVIAVLGGAGRIGNRVCEDLTREFNTVLAFDPRYSHDEEINTPMGKIIKTSDVTHLASCKLYIALMHHGDVIRDFQHHIPAGALVADDTHPCISLEVREQMSGLGIKTLKIVLAHEDFSMWPRMPGWNNRAIPGCLVEALVLLEQEDTDVTDFDAFSKTALKIGFKGQLIKPLDE